jgi:hypothetical protein
VVVPLIIAGRLLPPPLKLQARPVRGDVAGAVIHRCAVPQPSQITALVPKELS